jgi:dTDP-glucose 4,6-dehydratase
MKILVTGVKGFLGTNVAEYYLKNTDYDVVGIGNNLSKQKEYRVISDLERLGGDRFAYKPCNLTNDVRLKSVLDKENPDVIINCASQSEVNKSFEQPYEFLKANLEGVFNLLEWLRYTNAGTRFVQLSTEAVFGDGLKSKQSEEGVLSPLNPYAASKAASEHYINAYNFCFGLNTVIVRPVNNFGPYQNPNKLIAKAIINCIKNIPFKMHGEEDPNKRFWLYAADTVMAIDYIIKHGGSGTYNLTTEEGFTAEEAVRKILEIAGTLDLLSTEYSEVRRKDSEHYQMSGSKIKNLGWSPKYSFEDGIKNTIDWFRNNAFWYNEQEVEI